MVVLIIHEQGWSEGARNCPCCWLLLTVLMVVVQLQHQLLVHAHLTRLLSRLPAFTLSKASWPCSELFVAAAVLFAQDVELYLTKQSRENGFALVARVGRFLQELLVDTSLSKDDMKKALTRVLSRVR